ncbi:MAG: hypothetical protein ACJ8FY_05575 [Gemmataceae bacterium]
MENPSATQPHPQDPFAGYGAQPVTCQWFSNHDEQSARSAEIIRLILDDQRGHCDAWANDVYQQHFLREVQDFIGPTNAVLVTDAGSIKTYIPPISQTVGCLRSGLTTLGEALSRIELGQMELLLGVDGCVAGEATHLQTVAHLKGKPEVSLDNTTVKLYPAGDERDSLIGWRICNALRRVPEDLAKARRVQTSLGTILVLVCNDAAIFSARSRSNLGNSLGLAIRDHFTEQSRAEPRPAYILIATHWQGTNPKTGRWSGEAFRQAANYLTKETGATVVTTMRTPRQEFALAADRFPIVGPRSEKVATLLVSDTS